MKKLRKILSLLAACSVLFVGCAKGNEVGDKEVLQEDTAQKVEKETLQEKGEPQVVTIGFPNISTEDPRYRDPVTGESLMPPDKLHAAEIALQAVRDELNVDLQFVQYPGRPDEILLQSVLAGDPIADLAYMWTGSQGTVLAQNVLQSLDDYTYIFEGEHDWMLWDKVVGSHFFVNNTMTYLPLWPLVYNIDYIEQVDALKVDGKTVYPTDLFLEGKWTWSTFEDYLAKIDAHFRDSKAPLRPEVRIEPYQTDYREAVLHATYANGGSIYGKEGLQVDKQENKEAVKYVKNLMDRGLLTCQRWQEGNSEPSWVLNCINFQNGETVFTNTEHWRIPHAVSAAGERGEAIGIVPFPRPDDMDKDDPRYQQPGTAGDCFGVLKGISPEQTELALKTFVVYYSTYYEVLADSDKATDFLQVNMDNKIAEYGIDIFHKEIGADMRETFVWMVDNLKINDFSQLTDVYYKQYMPLVGDSFYGLNGIPAYDIAIEANKGVLEDYVNNILTMVQSDEIRDNIPPKFKTVSDLSFPVGTDINTINWSDYIAAADGVDGDLDLAKAMIDASAIDFNKIGLHEAGLTVTIKDKSGNEGKANFNVVIYDKDHTTSPTITLKEEYRTIALDEDVEKINWVSDFIEETVDKDGLDISKTIEVDLSELDTSTPGTYKVRLNVTDYIGNKGEAILEVQVK